MIRKVTLEDAAAIAPIYNYYVENTNITFETEPVSVAEMQDRIATISKQYPYFVYESEGIVVGYCYVNQWKKKYAYHHTAETTVYLAPGFQGKGIGRALMQHLIEALKSTSVHALIACLTVPNPESVRLHERLGFEKVSHFKSVGRKFDRWIDVEDWELVLE
jgi:phosphinothricin acetyltransferase